MNNWCICWFFTPIATHECPRARFFLLLSTNEMRQILSNMTGQLFYPKFCVHTAILTKIRATVVWVVTPFHLINGYKCLGVIEIVGFLRDVAFIFQTTWRHILE
jgi:hypothetical protein